MLSALGIEVWGGLPPLRLIPHDFSGPSLKRPFSLIRAERGLALVLARCGRRQGWMGRRNCQLIFDW